MLVDSVIVERVRWHPLNVLTTKGRAWDKHNTGVTTPDRERKLGGNARAAQHITYRLGAVTS